MRTPEFWELLRCPETRQRLVPADRAVVERINAGISQGQVRNRAGRPVTEPIDGGLIREDRSWLYPVRDRLPILLVEEALAP